MLHERTVVSLKVVSKVPTLPRVFEGGSHQVRSLRTNPSSAVNSRSPDGIQVDNVFHCYPPLEPFRLNIVRGKSESCGQQIPSMLKLASCSTASLSHLAIGHSMIALEAEWICFFRVDPSRCNLHMTLPLSLSVSLSLSFSSLSASQSQECAVQIQIHIHTLLAASAAAIRPEDAKCQVWLEYKCT